MRINPRVSIAVRGVLGTPARPVTITNMLTRYRQAMYTQSYVRPGEEFNPPINAEMVWLLSPVYIWCDGPRITAER